MAQQSFNRDPAGNPLERNAASLAQSRGAGARAASFIGGNVDGATGNLTPGTPQQVSRGFTVTGSEAPKVEAPTPTPVPDSPSRLQQITPDPAPTPAAAPAPAPAPAPAANPIDRLLTPGLLAKDTVASDVGSFFCYGWGVMILMEDGTWREVQTLRIGDRVMLGGEVTAVGQAKGSFTFDYKGCPVTGSHAVFEDGRFVRVKDSDHRSNEDSYRGGIYPVMTEKFLLVTPTHISADFGECEGGYDMTPVQRLSVMNRDVQRLRWLSDQEAILCHAVA